MGTLGGNIVGMLLLRGKAATAMARGHSCRHSCPQQGGAERDQTKFVERRSARELLRTKNVRALLDSRKFSWYASGDLDGLDSDFENLVKTSRRFLKRDGMLKRRGREGLRRGRRANSASLASASSAGDRCALCVKTARPEKFQISMVDLEKISAPTCNAT